MVAILAAVSACTAQPTTTNTVEIRNNTFQPGSLAVPAGTTVTWINYDPAAHTVTASDGSFDSGEILSGGRFMFTFANPGTYIYGCRIHPNMQGTIQVAPGLASTGTLIYAQYYRLAPGPVPTTPITAPVSFNILGQEPANVYVAGQQLPIPYSQYQAYATNLGANALWIQGTNSWAQYAQVPLGSSLSLVAASANPDNGYLYEVYPDGRTSTSQYYFDPYSLIGFYADRVGRHMLFFVLGNQVSNGIIIDVAGYQPGAYPQQPVQPQTTGNVVSY
ncbi:MAG TPA: cupredoxin family copper-binding protein [Methanotrichaceae archaeon]|nr:cupredoxin family copper-binding protein [Methanotrichaceae archaeon]